MTVSNKGEVPAPPAELQFQQMCSTASTDKGKHDPGGDPSETAEPKP